MTSDTASGSREKSQLIEAMKQGLEEGGAVVEIEGVMRGAHGAKHTFDLIATRAAKRIPIDVRLSQNAQLEFGDVLETYAKALDANARPAVIVAIPGASPEARKSASAFGLVLVEGSGPTEVLERLGRALIGIYG